MNLNNFAKRAYWCALRRGKIHGHLSGDSLRKETVCSLLNEVHEVATSTQERSEHMPEYSSTVEEITDVLIVCCTELFRRGVNIEDALERKMASNENRK